MIELIQYLFAHMAWADNTLLKAVASQEGAYGDEELRKLLHHILIVQRYFLSLFRQSAFDPERERQIPDTIEEMMRRFEEAHADGAAYTAALTETELSRSLNFPPMPTFHPAIRDALVQVATHSGSPPAIDYIIWVRDVRDATSN